MRPDVVQSWQAAPKAPHSVSVVGVMHVAPRQQPKAQVMGPHAPGAPLSGVPVVAAPSSPLSGPLSPGTKTLGTAPLQARMQKDATDTARKFKGPSRAPHSECSGIVDRVRPEHHSGLDKPPAPGFRGIS
jgi:hypothetical protein